MGEKPPLGPDFLSDLPLRGLMEPGVFQGYGGGGGKLVEGGEKQVVQARAFTREMDAHCAEVVRTVEERQDNVNGNGLEPGIGNPPFPGAVVLRKNPPPLPESLARHAC